MEVDVPDDVLFLQEHNMLPLASHAIIASDFKLVVVFNRVSPVSFRVTVSLTHVSDLHAKLEAGYFLISIEEDASKGLYLNLFYNNIVTRKTNGEWWDVFRRHGVRPTGFLVPVLRAFIEGHLIGEKYVHREAPLTLNASGKELDTSQLKLVNYYMSLGFRLDVYGDRILTRTMTSHEYAISMTCKSISHFLQRSAHHNGWQIGADMREAPTFQDVIIDPHCPKHEQEIDMDRRVTGITDHFVRTL